jgi:hypothetical protein
MTFNGSLRKKRRPKGEPTSKIRTVSFYRSLDDEDPPIRGSVWSIAEGPRRVWVVPLEGDHPRPLTLVKYVNPRWVLDTDTQRTIA